MQFYRAATFAALFISITSFGLRAEDVTLTSPDGKVEVNGTLIGYDGEFYRVDTTYGVLTLDGTGVACAGPACPDLERFVAEITVAGAYDMGARLLPALVEGFASQSGMGVRRLVQNDHHFTYQLTDIASGRPLAKLTFNLSESSAGLKDLISGQADLAISTREVRPDEVAAAKAAGLGDLTDVARSRILALDGYVPIVAKSNPVRAIAPVDLAKILQGQINNWSDLGGIDAPIILHLRAATSGFQQGLQDRLAGEGWQGAIAPFQHHDDNASLSDAVARDGFALGITSHSELGNAVAMALKGGCDFGFSASQASLKAEDYPLTSPLFLYIPARRLPKIARQFLSYVSGPSAQAVIRRAGFIDQSWDERPIAAQGDRLANAITLAGPETDLAELQRLVVGLRPFQRVSTTFRFEPGSSRLDAQSRANVERVALALETGAYDKRDLMFVGFSDGDGGAQVNLRIARSRAQKVRDAVLKSASAADLSGFDITVDAFGEAMPMACDDTEWGRRVNRRVEVWLRR